MYIPFRTAVLFSICSFVAAGASAQQRPLVTEDPETIGADRILLEGGVSFDTGQTNFATGVTGDITRLASLGVSIGISPNAEIQIDGGLVQRLEVTDRVGSGPLDPTMQLLVGDTYSSLEDLVVATKIRVASETESRPAVGLRFGTKLPLADSENGIGLGTTDFLASFLLAKTVQSVRTVGNVSLFILDSPVELQDAVRALGFGVSIARAVTNEFEVVGEVNGRLDPFGDVVPPGLENRGIFRLAGRYTYSMLRLDFGVVAGFTDRDPSFGISAGATYVFAR